MLAISAVASVNGQFDRLVLSGMLSVLDLGYYMLAVALAQGLLTLMSPVGTVMLPRFANLYSAGELDRAVDLFRNALRGGTIVIGAAAMTLCFHAEEVLFAWTGNPALVAQAAPVLPYIVIGTALLALQVLPFSVAIANGYTRINVVMAIAAVGLSLPAYVLAVDRYGMLGAAAVWMTLQAVATPIYFALVHRRFLPGRLSFGQYVLALAPPFAVAAGANLLLQEVPTAGLARGAMLLWLAGVALAVLGITGFLLPAALRRRVLQWPLRRAAA
jgi:O-antigen/teichoic acid export membrane protein